MSKPLTPAQLAQQKNRNLDGTYRTKYTQGETAGIHLAPEPLATVHTSSGLPPILGLEGVLDGRPVAVTRIDEDPWGGNPELTWTDTHTPVTSWYGPIAITRLPDTPHAHAFLAEREAAERRREANNRYRDAQDAAEAALLEDTNGNTTAFIATTRTHGGIAHISGQNKDGSKFFRILADRDGNTESYTPDHTGWRRIGPDEQFSRAHTTALANLQKAQRDGIIAEWIDSHAAMAEAEHNWTKPRNDLREAAYRDATRRHVQDAYADDHEVLRQRRSGETEGRAGRTLWNTHPTLNGIIETRTGPGKGLEYRITRHIDETTGQPTGYLKIADGDRWAWERHPDGTETITACDRLGHPATLASADQARTEAFDPTIATDLERVIQGAHLA